MKVHLNIVKKNDQFISDAIRSFFDSNKKLSSQYTAKRINTIWKEEMGPTIYSYTKRLNYNNGTLRIYLTSSTLRQELSMSIPQIISMINRELGSNMVNKVIVC